MFISLRIIVIILMFSLTAESNECLKQQRAFWFANGMMTSRESTEQTLEKIMILKKSTFVNFNVAYNENEQVGEQLLEVLEQKLSSDSKSFWMWMSDFDEAPVWFRKYAEDLVLKYNKRRLVIDKDLQRQVADYYSELKQGLEVVTLAHSQGNFYTNEAFQIVAKKSFLGNMLTMVSVATPDSKVWRGGEHFTLEGDFIHKVPGALPWNINNLTEDYRGHYINKHYLKGKPSGQLILNALGAMGNSQLTVLSDNYLSSSFEKFARWLRIFESLNEKRPQLNNIQCLAINLFVYQTLWSNLNCRERDFHGLNQYFKSHGDIYKLPKTTTFPKPLYGISSVDSGSFGSFNEYIHIFSKHPNCEISRDQEFEMYMNGDFEKALIFIKKPDFKLFSF